MQMLSDKKIYGLLGYPVKHSFSPFIHNAAFRALKINAEYRLFEVKPQELEDFLLTSVFSEDISGFNITIPYKVKAKQIMEEKFPLPEDNLLREDLYYVRASGAVNTVKRNGDKLEYYNTDVNGFLISLDKDLHFNPKSKTVLVIGCGGAGRAVIAGLSWKDNAPKKIYVNDTSDEAIKSAKELFFQFERFRDKLEFISSEKIPEVIGGCDLLINASGAGMEGEDVSLVDENLLHDRLAVYDLVYNKETRLIKDAKSRGLNAADGRTMLLYQGALAFEIWTGQSAPVKQMRQALTEAIKR